MRISRVLPSRCRRIRSVRISSTTAPSITVPCMTGRLLSTARRASGSLCQAIPDRRKAGSEAGTVNPVAGGGEEFRESSPLGGSAGAEDAASGETGGAAGERATTLGREARSLTATAGRRSIRSSAIFSSGTVRLVVGGADCEPAGGASCAVGKGRERLSGTSPATTAEEGGPATKRNPAKPAIRQMTMIPAAHNRLLFPERRAGRRRMSLAMSTLPSCLTLFSSSSFRRAFRIELTIPLPSICR